MKQLLAENREILLNGRSSKFVALVPIGLLLAMGLFAPRATASIYTLSPGGTQNPADSSGFPVGGSIVGSPLTSSFETNTASGTLEGSVTSTVYSGDTSNPYHGLTFTYLLTISANSTDSSSELTADSFAGFLTDVSYNPSNGGIAPSFFQRSSGAGEILHFSWSFNNVGPGQSGDLIVVQTGATSFGTGTGGVTDGGGVTVSILTPVPEPTIGSLVSMGLGALFIFRCRKSK